MTPAVARRLDELMTRDAVVVASDGPHDRPPRPCNPRVDELLTVPAYRARQEVQRSVNTSEWQPADTFVIKVYRREGGALSGLIEHLRTGEKQGFTDLASVTSLMAVMISRTDPPTREARS